MLVEKNKFKGRGEKNRRKGERGRYEMDRKK
jgi:hypothetical protein